MFMQIAIGAIGIGVVLMVGFIVVSQVRSALPSASNVGYINTCKGNHLNSSACNASATDACTSDLCNTCGSLLDNTSNIVYCTNTAFTTGTGSVQVTVFAGFALVAVGIIVLAAFGLIQVFQ